MFPPNLFASAYDVLEFLLRLSFSSEEMASFSKVIHTPANSYYLAVIDVSIENLRFLTANALKHRVIMTPVTVNQVQATVNCARSQWLQISIRSGGHAYEGLSYLSDTEFVILDMVNLPRIDLDAESATAWVQSGATIDELYYRIAEKRKTLGFPAGVCTTVGVGGHFSGGGYATLLRKMGSRPIT